jgi:antitoxin HicB
VRRYPAVVRELDPKEGGGFLAEIPDLPGCVSDGETAEEAVANVYKAALEWIDAAEKLGRQIPDPSDKSGSYSGKWVQRVPKSLHRTLATEARREGVSLNTLVIGFLAESVAKRRVA